jgi:adenylyl-sulfate kinase
MLIDFLKRNDPFLKRNFFKTVSWRLVGSIDTILIGWLISGKFSIGAQIGLIELFTKTIIYYAHERYWQSSNLGLPTKAEISLKVQNEIQPNLFKHTGKINRRKRELLNQQRAYTIWLTGLSGSGKSTISNEIEEWIFSNSGRVYVLDGDNTRLGINKDLSFSNEDRKENIRRVAEICRLFNDAGIIVVAPLIAPFEQDRKDAMSIIGRENYIEIYVEASVAVCIQRDPKGLYRKAINGDIKNFTGISSPYEVPLTPDIHLNTENLTLEDCLEIIKRKLHGKLFLYEQSHFFSD